MPPPPCVGRAWSSALIWICPTWGGCPFPLQPSVYELVRAPGFAHLPLIVEDFVKDSGASFSGELGGTRRGQWGCLLQPAGGPGQASHLELRFSGHQWSAALRSRRADPLIGASPLGAHGPERVGGWVWRQSPVSGVA